MGAVKILPTKVCSKCERRKTYDHFYLKNFKPNGWCKDCYKARHDLKMEERQVNLMKTSDFPIITTSNRTTPYPGGPHSPRPTPAPKPHQSTARALSTEEKAELWDQATALQLEARQAQAEIDRQRFKLQSVLARRDALFAANVPGGSGSGAGAGGGSKTIDLGPCHGCGFTNCVCERVGG